MKTLLNVLNGSRDADHARIADLEAALASRDSELQRTQRVLNRLIARQEELIERRTAEFGRARDEAIAASVAKSAFLANMSHEIRTPLTSIIGFAELLLDPDTASIDKGDALRTIIRNGRHLLEVISDILDLVKIEAHQIDLERIDLPLPILLRDLNALVSGRAAERSLEFVVRPALPLPASIPTDPVRLKQILLNFFSNAIKFTSKGSVALELAYAAERRALRFDVIDTGIGMSEDQLARLFQPFAQADVSTTRKFGGTGLGLYISRQLAERLGGEVSVHSAPGKGSTFSLELILPQGERPPEMLTMEGDLLDYGHNDFAVTGISVPDLSGRVLLAEDGADNQRLLSAYLKQAGLSVTVVGNGRDAVQTAMSRDFDIVLMDIQMPIMDGVAATQMLRSVGFGPPIVALTANVMKADIQRYREAGCNDVLAKPVDRDRFYAALAKHLNTAVTAAPGSGAIDTDYQREMAQLTAEFRAGLPAQLDAIRSALRRSDVASLQSLIHTLKGTAGSYGYGRLTELAGAVEQELAAQRNGRAALLCEGLILEGTKALKKLNGAS